MSTVLAGNAVRAPCPGCSGAISTFTASAAWDIDGIGSRSVSIFHQRIVGHERPPYICRWYMLLRCGGCGRGAFAAVLSRSEEDLTYAELEEFHPLIASRLPLPKPTPEGIEAEFREAETCASVRAFRAASGMLRSALEKLFRANGYRRDEKETKNLFKCIDQAQADGLITPVLGRRAHDNVRVLGNDVLHDDWREVDEEEYEAAHGYVQRIVEAFYDHREEAVKQLVASGRTNAAGEPVDG